MKKLPIFALGLAFLAGLSGCSSTNSGPKLVEKDALKTRDSFCKAWADAACNEDVVDSCQAADEDTCMAAQKTYCVDRIPVGYVATHAQDCIDAVKRAYSDSELNKTELDLVLNLGGDCSHLVKGPSGAGVTCTDSTECDTTKSYSCVIKAGNTEGTCQIPKLQGPGEPCDEPAQVCDTGAYCAGSDADGYNCLVTRAEGKSCTYDAMCDATDFCDPDTGKCAPKLTRSKDCTAPEQCASGICLQAASASKCADSVKLTFGSPYCVDLGGA